MAPYTHVLLAVDFSDAIPVLIERAKDLARRYGARLSLAHVVEPLVIDPSYEVFPSVPIGVETELRAHALDKLKEFGAANGVAAGDCHVLIGSTKSELLRLAEQQGCDLLVVGSHGRHGVALLLGSTANAVLHGASCDVLAVRINA